MSVIWVQVYEVDISYLTFCIPLLWQKLLILEKKKKGHRKNQIAEDLLFSGSVSCLGSD